MDGASSSRKTFSCSDWSGQAGEDEALELALAGRLGIPHDQLVAVRIDGEVAEQRARMQIFLLAPHALEPRREALVLAVALDDPPPGLALLAAPAPVELEEHVPVQIREDLVEVDLDLPRSPERRRRNGDVDARAGAHR